MKKIKQKIESKGVQAARVYAPRDAELAAVKREVSLVGDTSGGSTAQFNVFYDSSLGTDGVTIADAILETCEGDYLKLQELFGGVTPTDLPFNVHITTGSTGASHATCAATDISIGARSAPSVNISFMRSLFIAEVDEVFEAAIGLGWDCGASHGEGLSRVVANEMYPGAMPSNFVSAPEWLNGGRTDFVNNTEDTDQNYVSIGCSVLFLNFLHYQLNFSWNKIILAGAATLGQTYSNLTRQTDGFDQFKTLLDANFPEDTTSKLGTDNPFPLPSG
jgi:hypothetical protein